MSAGFTQSPASVFITDIETECQTTDDTWKGIKVSPGTYPIVDAGKTQGGFLIRVSFLPESTQTNPVVGPPNGDPDDEYVFWVGDDPPFSYPEDPVLGPYE